MSDQNAPQITQAQRDRWNKGIAGAALFLGVTAILGAYYFLWISTNDLSVMNEEIAAIRQTMNDSWENTEKALKQSSSVMRGHVILDDEPYVVEISKWICQTPSHFIEMSGGKGTVIIAKNGEDPLQHFHSESTEENIPVVFTCSSDLYYEISFPPHMFKELPSTYVDPQKNLYLYISQSAGK